MRKVRDLRGSNSSSLVEEHADGGEDQEDAEHVDDPAELVDQCHAEEDHQRAEHHGPQHAVEQHLVLVLPRNAERGEDERDDEDVVHAQRQLDQVAGDVFHHGGGGGEARGVLHPSVPKGQVHNPGEQGRAAHPDGRPGAGLLGGDHMRVLVEHPEVQRQRPDDEGDEGDPQDHILEGMGWRDVRARGGPAWCPAKVAGRRPPRRLGNSSAAVGMALVKRPPWCLSGRA